MPNKVLEHTHFSQALLSGEPKLRQLITKYGPRKQTLRLRARSLNAHSSDKDHIADSKCSDYNSWHSVAPKVLMML